MTVYQWHEPHNAQAARDLERRQETARLAELHQQTLAAEARVRLMAQRARRIEQRILPAKDRKALMAEAEEYRARAVAAYGSGESNYRALEHEMHEWDSRRRPECRANAHHQPNIAA